MATTIPQLQTALDTLSLDITNTLQSGANVSGPVLAALLTRQSALLKDLSTLQAAGASTLRYGAANPANSLGTNNDIYRNTSTWDEFQKVNGAYVLRGNIRGGAGYTPVKGTDYVDGEDGLDGNEIVDKTYAPTASDNAGYKEGDQWFYTKSVSSYERYAHINGQWRLVFKTSDSTPTTPTTPTADTQAPNLSFTAPASGATVPVGTQLTLTATATDNVAVTAVEFLNGATGASLGQGAKNGNTYTLPYTVSVAGPFSFVAKASDAASNSQTATVNITVQAATVAALAVVVSNEPSGTVNTGVAVNIGYTASGGVAPYSHAVKATNDVTGAVTNIGSASTPVYNASWTPTTAGSYSLTDTVTDSAGTVKISAVRSVTVNAAPVSGGATHFIMVGNSRYDTNGNASGSTTITSLMQNAYAGNSSLTFQRFSYPGSGVYQAAYGNGSINSKISSEIGPAITAAINAGKTVHVIMEGGLNDLGFNVENGQDVTTNKNNVITALKSFHSQVQALGAKSSQETVFMGVAGSFAQAQQDSETAAILAVNAELRANYRAPAWNLEAISDVISDSRLATADATLDTAIYSDRVHLTVAGKGVHAAVTQKLIPVLLAGQHSIVVSDYVSGNTTPAAPTLSAEDTANTLSASHALGSSEILVSTNNGAYVAYAGPIAVGDVARPVGYYKFKIKAAAGRNESPITNSPAFTAGVAQNGDVTVEAAQFTYTAPPDEQYKSSYGPGGTFWGFLGTATYAPAGGFSATTARVEYLTGPGTLALRLRVDGVDYEPGMVTGPNANEYRVQDFTLPAGVHTSAELIVYDSGPGGDRAYLHRARFF